MKSSPRSMKYLKETRIVSRVKGSDAIMRRYVIMAGPIWTRNTINFCSIRLLNYLASHGISCKTMMRINHYGNRRHWSREVVKGIYINYLVTSPLTTGYLMRTIFRNRCFGASERSFACKLKGEYFTMLFHFFAWIIPYQTLWLRINSSM